MKSSGIGGQAVMEGIMMKNGDTYAVAVRKPDKEIVVKKDVHRNFIKNEKLTKLPFLRGVFNFIDSLVLGMSTLTYSAEFYEEEEEPTKVDRFFEKVMGGFGEKFMMGMTVAVSIILAVAIFMILPYFLAELFKNIIVSDLVLALLEGVIRVAILLGYIVLISKIEDIQRVFMYHGAEHKCINCIENGLELNVENVMKSSKEHKRCGTSFLLVVMFVSIIFFLFIRVDSGMLRVVLRILLVPVIAGVSYEFIRLAGRSENKVVAALSKPGMMLQKLTTKEPDESMVEVAIKAVEAVFDWKEFLEENKAEFAADKAKAKEEAAKADSDKKIEKSTGAEEKKDAAGKAQKDTAKADVKKETTGKKNTSKANAGKKSAAKNAVKQDAGQKKKNAKAAVEKKAEQPKIDVKAVAEKKAEQPKNDAKAGAGKKAEQPKADAKPKVDSQVVDSKETAAKTVEQVKDTTKATVEVKKETEKTNVAQKVVIDKKTPQSKDVAKVAIDKKADQSKDITKATVDKKADQSKDVTKATVEQKADQPKDAAKATVDKKINQPKAAVKTTAKAATENESETVPEYSVRKTTTAEIPDEKVEEDKSLQAPRLTSVDDSEEGVIKLTWDKVRKASGYVVYRKNAEEEVYKLYPDIKKNMFDDTEIEPKMIYYYKVRAYVKKGDKKVYGQFSPIESNGYSSRIKSKY